MRQRYIYTVGRCTKNLKFILDAWSVHIHRKSALSLFPTHQSRGDRTSLQPLREQQMGTISCCVALISNYEGRSRGLITEFHQLVNATYWSGNEIMNERRFRFHFYHLLVTDNKITLIKACIKIVVNQMKITEMVAMVTQRPKLKHTVNIPSQSTWQKLLKSCSAKICDGHESLRIFLSCHNMLLRLLFLLEWYRTIVSRT